MSSVLVNTIVETVLNSSNSTYASKDIIRNEFKNIEADTSLDLIYEKYQAAKNRTDKINEAIYNCKSDYAYWGHVSDSENNKLIIRIYAAIIFSKLDIDDILEVKTAYIKSQELDSIKARIKENLAGLNKYKPSGYKSKIEMLNEILGV